jgi:hypothetical protein
VLGDKIGAEELAAVTAAILDCVRREKASHPVRHRALDDARQERWAWLRTKEIAQAAIAS